jgi:hypothetical protein
MAEDANDVIVQITDAIRKQYGDQKEFAISFDELETNWAIPAGSIAKYLDDAASDLGLEVVRRGSNRATLRKKGPSVYIA